MDEQQKMFIKSRSEKRTKLDSEFETLEARLIASEKRCEKFKKALEFYANKDNWEYTDCGGQFSWYCTLEKDMWTNPDIGEGGGNDYAGKTAREALNEGGRDE